ncbi:MAG: hypothetical protein NTV80_08660, partial [Verrucomicrobia bacterium]|nr:hypothetical protein [Verrucomicrobiota bacterium]
MSSLPEIDDFYTTFFDRWYSDDDRDRKRFKFTRPDIMKLYKPEVSVSEICALNDEYRDEAERRVFRIFSSAKSDWPTFLPLSEPVNETWIQLFDEHYVSEVVADLIQKSDPEDFANDVVVSVCQFGAVLGFVLQGMVPRLEWL